VRVFRPGSDNGYGLKVFAFLKLAGSPFAREHIFNASTAPRGQIPTVKANVSRAFYQNSLAQPDYL
jgi:hypothetical protein